jgi:hypothetical protein
MTNHPILNSLNNLEEESHLLSDINLYENEILKTKLSLENNLNEINQLLDIYLYQELIFRNYLLKKQFIKLVHHNKKVFQYYVKYHSLFVSPQDGKDFDVLFKELSLLMNLTKVRIVNESENNTNLQIFFINSHTNFVSMLNYNFTVKENIKLFWQKLLEILN